MMKNMRRRIGIGLMIACSWILLAAKAGAQPGSLDYAGFNHSPLGGATLSINPDGHLEVSNIGSSGLDGVRIAWTSPDAFLLKLGTVLSAPAEPTGTMLDVVIEGSLSGLFGSVTCTDIGSVFDFVVDYTPMGSSTYTLKILDSASQINLNLSGYSGGQNGTQQPESISSELHPDGNLCIMFMWDTPNTINVPGIGTFTAAAMMMISEIPPSPATSLPTEELFGNYHFLLEIAGTLPGPIVDETLTQFGNVHRALGAALLSVNTGGTLTVSNIGSSGLYGVTIDLEPGFSLSDSTADPVRLEIEFGPPFDPNPPGMVLEVAAEGKIKWTNPPSSATSLVSLTSSAGTTNITFDFQSIQASSARVEIRNGGLLVSSRIVPLGGDVATFGPASVGDPQIDGILAAAVIPMFSDKASLPGFRIKLDRDATITPTGFIPEIGDEVLVVANDPGGPVDSLTAVRLIANNSPPIAIISEPTIRGESIGGMPHTLLGEADSKSSDTDGDGFPDEIEVSNIGSSGLDGVAISIGQAQGWTGEVDFGPAGALAPGMSARFAMTTSPFIVGNDPAEVALVVSEGGGGGGRMALDYPSAAGDSVDVLLISNGVVVYQVTHPHPFPDPLVAGNIGSSGKDGVRVEAVNASVGNQRILAFEIPTATDLTLFIGGTILADAIRFVLTTPGQAYDPDDPLEIKFTASNFSPATISGQGLIAHELTHVVQGQAGISGVGDLSGDGLPDLVVSNIGSSGQDGVAVDVHGNWNFRHDRSHASLYKIEHDDVPGAVSPDCLIWEVVGQVNGGAPGERIMQPEYGANGGVWDVSIAPMPWNAPETVTVEVFSGGLSQGSVVGLAPGSVASGVSPAVPSSYQFELVVFDSATSTGIPASGVEHTFVWNSVISITLPGLAPLLGDELRVTALNAPTLKAGGTLPLIKVDSVVVTAATSASAPETTSLAVTGETVVLIDPCPGDVTGDGSVNVTDLLELLAAWGPCPAPPAQCLPDTNGNGTVNVTDLLDLLAAWGACP